MKIVAALDDLFFGVKISEAARRAGHEVRFVKDQKTLFDSAAGNPALIIIDLNCAAIKPLESITHLKSNAELQKINVIGYLSHVQTELKEKAHEVGCDMVLARSAFSQTLPDLLKKLQE